MEILETQERKMNKNKEKKKELTHFLGHYRIFFVELSVSFYQMLMTRCANAFCKMSLEKEYDAYPSKYNIIFCEVSRPSIFVQSGLTIYN